MRSLAARRYSDIRIFVERAVDPADDARQWAYELVFDRTNQQRPVIERERVVSDGNVLLERPFPNEHSDVDQSGQTYVQQASVNRDFRELAQAFERVRYLHLVPQPVRDPDRSIGRKNDPFGGDFLEQVAGVDDRTQRARLGRITQALKVVAPQLVEIQPWPGARGTPHLRGRYERWRPQGAWQRRESAFGWNSSPDGSAMGNARWQRAFVACGARAFASSRGREISAADVCAYSTEMRSPASR